MQDYVLFYMDDAVNYGEEAAIVLSLLRKAELFHDKDQLIFNNIEHIYLRQEYFERFLPYKKIKRTKAILTKLCNLNVISRQEGHYYAVLK
jgi:hypothetical protein